MERKTRIKVVAAALTVVFLASITVAGFASAASSNAAAGVYLTFAMSKVRYNYIELTSSSWVSMLSITVPNVGYSAWWKVECDGYTWLHNQALGIAIGVNSLSPDGSTYRFYGHSSIDTLYTGIHTQEMYYLGPGAHTFYFLGQRNMGTGNLGVAYYKITVTFFTDAYVTQVAEGEVSGNPEELR